MIQLAVTKWAALLPSMNQLAVTTRAALLANNTPRAVCGKREEQLQLINLIFSCLTLSLIVFCHR